MIRVTSSVLVLATGLNPAIASEPLPPAAQAVIREAKKLCDGAGVFRRTTTPIQRVDVFGRGKLDWVLSDENWECEGAYTIYGGTAGPTRTIISDVRGKAEVVFQTYSHALGFPSAGKIVVHYHGSACGRIGAEACVKQQRWDGRGFVLDRVLVGDGPQRPAAPVTTANISRTGSPSRSIVGTWAESAEACRSPDFGAVKIGPKSLSSDELSCKFQSVERNGSIVTWTGVCDEGRGDKPMRVSAADTPRGLVVSFKPGGTWAPLKKCGR